MSSILERLGMTEGQAIESSMVSGRIEAAQKKVEERHFDSRKHLLDYDEVMDTQRKEVYGFRQKILNDANPKILVMRMLDKQSDRAVERFLSKDYGAASFAEFAATRLGIEFDKADFYRSNYEEAVRAAQEKAARNVETQVIEALEENLGGDEASEWNWQALANVANKRWGIRTSDRDLKKIGKDALSDYLTKEAMKSISAVDLSDGKDFLNPDWGQRSLIDWARQRFQIKLSLADLTGKSEADIKALLRDKVRVLYRLKEIEFPVTAAMARFMSERTQGQMPGSQAL